jgi:hypothetical protein
MPIEIDIIMALTGTLDMIVDKKAAAIIRARMSLSVPFPVSRTIDLSIRAASGVQARAADMAYVVTTKM